MIQVETLKWWLKDDFLAHFQTLARTWRKERPGRGMVFSCVPKTKPHDRKVRRKVQYVKTKQVGQIHFVFGWPSVIGCYRWRLPTELIRWEIYRKPMGMMGSPVWNIGFVGNVSHQLFFRKTSSFFAHSVIVSRWNRAKCARSNHMIPPLFMSQW